MLMVEAVLSHFAAHTHPLTLVSDPDGVLIDEDILTEMYDRGFTLIQEHDPVLLRHRIERARPWSADRPLVVVTERPLNTLPYDLWQQGHPVTLALHTFFPKLSYPELRDLTPAQRARLTGAPEPTAHLCGGLESSNDRTR
jgi:hypothetical protein